MISTIRLYQFRVLVTIKNTQGIQKDQTLCLFVAFLTKHIPKQANYNLVLFISVDFLFIFFMGYHSVKDDQQQAETGSLSCSLLLSSTVRPFSVLRPVA